MEPGKNYYAKLHIPSDQLLGKLMIVKLLSLQHVIVFHLHIRAAKMNGCICLMLKY